MLSTANKKSSRYISNYLDQITGTDYSAPLFEVIEQV